MVRLIHWQALCVIKYMNAFNDLLFLGVALCETKHLLRVIGIKEENIEALSRSLGWSEPARAAFLESIEGGEKVLAAIELGRRTKRPRPKRWVLQGPADVASVARSTFTTHQAMVFVLDDMGALARLKPLALEGVDEIVQGVACATLSASCARAIIVVREELDVQLMLDVDERLHAFGIELSDVISTSARGYASLQKSKSLISTSPWEKPNALVRQTLAPRDL